MSHVKSSQGSLVSSSSSSINSSSQQPSALVDPPTLLLVTANIGSIFDSTDLLLNSWTSNFLSNIKSLKPHFVALHCQEVGGKNYEESMQNVDLFVKSLLKSQELIDFDHVIIFLDEDFTSTAKFTALGNLYFIHGSISDCQIWDFKEKKFLPVSGRQIFSGNIEDVSLKEKDKFPVEFFPECKWSRKGFMRTRWSLTGAEFDLINIHLFHDASNLTAMEEFPSAYTKFRQHALEYTLNRIESDEFQSLPFFIFGDFNFRLDTGGVIKKITKDIPPLLVKSLQKGNIEQMLYKNSSDESPFLTVGKKVFDLINQEDTFYAQSNHHWLLQYDNELDCFKSRLFEFPIQFPPSYPFTEDDCGGTYMKTRCPAWCDRVLASHTALQLILEYSQPNKVIYQMMGPTSPMGDHKPVLLSFKLKLTKTYANEMKVNGDPCCSPSQIVNTSSATSNSPATLANEIFGGGNEASHLPSVKGIRLRTVSTPIEYNFNSSYNSNSTVGVKVPSRRNNSLVPSASGDVENIQIHSQQWLAKTQSFLRSLSQQQTKSHRAKEAVHKTFSNDSTNIRRCKLIACEEQCTQEQTNGHQVVTSLTPPPPPSPAIQPVMSSHHSSSSEDGEWYAQLELLSEQVTNQQQHLDHTDQSNTTLNELNSSPIPSPMADETGTGVNLTTSIASAGTATTTGHLGDAGDDDGALKATGATDEWQFNSVTGLSAPLTKQKSLIPLTACNTADSGGSMTELTSNRPQESPREQTTPVTHQDLLSNNELAAIEIESVGLETKFTTSGTATTTAACCPNLNSNDDDIITNEKMNCKHTCQVEELSEKKNRRKLCPGCTVV